MKRFDIAPFALPNSPEGEVQFEEARDVEMVEVVFAGDHTAAGEASIHAQGVAANAHRTHGTPGRGRPRPLRLATHGRPVHSRMGGRRHRGKSRRRTHPAFHIQAIAHRTARFPPPQRTTTSPSAAPWRCAWRIAPRPSAPCASTPARNPRAATLRVELHAWHPHCGDADRPVGL